MLAAVVLAVVVLGGCRDYTQEERIKADAQTTTAQVEAGARIGVAQAEASAKVEAAKAEAVAKVDAAKAETEARKTEAQEETERARVWATKMIPLAVVLCLTLLGAIVFVFRGMLHLRRADRLPMLAAERHEWEMRRRDVAPPPVVVSTAEKMEAEPLLLPDAGMWLLVRKGEVVARIRPKRLTG